MKFSCGPSLDSSFCSLSLSPMKNFLLLPFPSFFLHETLTNSKNSSVVFAHRTVNNVVHFLDWELDSMMRLFSTYGMLSFILQRYDWGCSYQRQERSYSWTQIFSRWEFPSCWFQWQLCGYIWRCSAIQESWGMYWILKLHHAYGLVFGQ